ncbi:MAG: hypothetical protein ACM3RP_03770 [Chitinophagales bacterium]
MGKKLSRICRAKEETLPALTAHDHDYERSKSIRGFRWTKDQAGKISHQRLPGATIDEGSGRFGKTVQGSGTVWVVLG